MHGACGSSEWPGSYCARVARWCYCRYRSLRGATPTKKKRPQILLDCAALELTARRKTHAKKADTHLEQVDFVSDASARRSDRGRRQLVELLCGEETREVATRKPHGQVFNAKPVSRALHPVAAFLHTALAGRRWACNVPCGRGGHDCRGPFACSQDATPSSQIPLSPCKRGMEYSKCPHMISRSLHGSALYNRQHSHDPAHERHIRLWGHPSIACFISS
jgi:hypothetical protein